MSEDFCLARVPLSQSFDKRKQAFHGGDFNLCLVGISRLQASPDPSKKKAYWGAGGEESWLICLLMFV